mmetsp:Transcript_8144/g.16924  ORF Transcript_8144/g.16924 Transcript_8144/m.16924 type:complete len:86 (+) Transcript_8144:74-331(+)
MSLQDRKEFQRGSIHRRALVPRACPPEGASKSESWPANAEADTGIISTFVTLMGSAVKIEEIEAVDAGVTTQRGACFGSSRRSSA